MELAVDSFTLWNRANVDEVFSVYGAPDFIAGVPKYLQGWYSDAGKSLVRFSAHGVQSAPAAHGSANVTFRPEFRGRR